MGKKLDLTGQKYSKLTVINFSHRIKGKKKSGKSESKGYWTMAWQKRNPGKKKYHDKNYDLKRTFGINLSEYNDMLEEQEFICPICKRHRKEFKIDFAVDHDHETGKIRELLCCPCNLALGSFEDDPVRMRNAANYIEKHKKFENFSVAKCDGNSIMVTESNN